MAPATSRWFNRVGGILILSGIILFFLGVSKRVAAKIPSLARSSSPATMYHPDLVCDDNGHRKEYRRQAFRSAKFRETFPEGCWALMRMPVTWKGNWHSYPVNAKNCPSLYYSMQNHHGVWPFDWCDQVDHHYGEAFWVQAVQPGEEIEFSTDDPNIAGPALDTNRPSPPSTKPVVISKVEPMYSEEARAAKFSGTVSVSVVVGEDGTVRDIRINESPGLGLDENIIAALKQWKFKPATKDGQPIAAPAKIDVSFKQF